MEGSFEVFDGIMSWLEAGKLNISWYDKTSFKLAADAHQMELDSEDQLLAFKSVPQECQLEQHAIFVSNQEVALMQFITPRAKQDKPEIAQVASLKFKLTSVECLLLHKHTEKGNNYLMTVILHDGCSITQILFNIAKCKFHQKTY